MWNLVGRLRQVVYGMIVMSGGFGWACQSAIAQSVDSGPTESRPTDSPSLESQSLEGQEYFVKPGFVLERYVDRSLTERPISAAIDSKGRLFVTEASGTNAPSKQQVIDRPHRIVVLTDENQDGKPDRRTVFAEGLMLPEGILCDGDSVYVAAPPEIWKFTDFDGDLVADKREVWLDAKTLTGCANDLHGPFLGRDGWIYWCKGAFAEQAWPQPHHPEWRTKASHVFRRHPHTGQVEPVYTSGMDNPVELAFTAAGERFVCGTFLVHPANGQRDGLVHAVYGGLYGKPQPALDGQWKTSPDLMPIMQHLGPAAPAAVTCLETDGFGADLRGAMVVAQFNLQQVSAHRLTRSGATFTSDDQTLVRSAQVDFHPTDVIELHEGSLLIVDTGGWYRLCCPTSHLDQSLALGGIYRLRPKSAGPVNQLMDAYAPRSPPKTEQDHLWREVQQGDEAALKKLRSHLQSTDPTLRKIAMHGVGLWRDTKSLPALLEIVQSEQPDDARTAAEAIGRMGVAEAIPVLLRQASHCHDPVLRHALLYGAMEIANRPAPDQPNGTKQLSVVRAIFDQATDVPLQIAAAIVIDQLANEDDRDAWVSTQRMLQWLASSQPQDRKLASWLLTRRRDAAMEVVRWMNEAKALPEEWTPHAFVELVHLPALQEAERTKLAEWFRRTEKPSLQPFAFAFLQSIAPNEIPSQWERPLIEELQQDPQATLKRFAMDRNQTIQLAALKQSLVDLSQSSQANLETRLRAYLLTGGTSPGEHRQAFEVALRALLDEDAIEERQWALRVLAKIPAQSLDAQDLLKALPQVGPLETRVLLEALARSSAAADADALNTSLRNAKQLTLVPGNELTELFRKSPAEIREIIQRFRNDFELSQAEQKEHLKTLSASLPEGNRLRGLQVFRSSKAACSACHTIGYVGGKTGPDLSRIGQIRTRMDLLEAIVYPSQSFVRSYEPVTILSRSGQVISGLEQPGSALEMVLLTGPNTTQRIPRAEIETVSPGTVSVMPAGLDRQLSPQELADLLALLGEAK